MLAVCQWKSSLLNDAKGTCFHWKEEPMENNLYTWHNELMVAMEMRELRREIDHICLLRDVGLNNPGWIERALIAFGNSLARYGKNLRDNYTDPRQAYQQTSGKLAS
jgi:hypothetical protein